jgi:hypothetical protein
MNPENFITINSGEATGHRRVRKISFQQKKATFIPLQAIK